MGPVLAFHRISDADAARITADAEAALDLIDRLDHTGEPNGDIDKAWDGLRYLLEAANIDLDLFGDLDPWAGDGATRIWSAAEIAAAARILTATPYSVLEKHFDPAAMDDDDIYPAIWDTDFCRDFLRENYDALREFFVFAAERDSQAVVLFQ
ncbi:DUF1877 family protein [Nocardia caishijiensis]|uniref:Uncharacterized protein DUF1877 n=1 Tax=Nocardia caishijiensis TaxID=184756 RepID=A0ABQ6YFT2_9NOCA|nr:DUF1877 family protein [Nocardia caishijiensis]KAF0836527.1 uncharacterized protein DUF1877 [Nocardia caishijiensis]